MYYAPSPSKPRIKDYLEFGKKTKVLYFYELMKYPQKRKKVFTAGAKISMTFQLGAHMLTGGKYPNEQNFFGKCKTQLLNIRLSIGKFSAEYNINGRIGGD